MQRLHPLTPLVRGAKVFGALAAFGLYQSYRTVQQVGIGPVGAVVLGIIIAAFAASWLSWRFTGYQIVDRELHVQEGILARRHRSIPLERVQAIDVVRPLLARVLGLAEIRLEVVGQNESEAPLAYLTTGDAVALRNRLLNLVADKSTVDDEPAQTPERPLFTVKPRELILSQLLSPYTLALPLFMAFPFLGLFVEGLSIPALIGAVSGVVGVAQQPVRRILAEYNFAASDTDDGLRLRHGMLEARTQTVPAGRIQAVHIVRPLLWRRFGWVRVEINVAGYGGGENQSGRTNALIPVADEATAMALVAHVFPQLNDDAPDGLDAIPLLTAPRRARWVAPLQHRKLAAGATRSLFIARSGWLTTRHDIAVNARVQSLRFNRGPRYRLLNLGSLSVDLAGPHRTPMAYGLDIGQILTLMSDMVALTRAARPSQQANRAPITAAPVHRGDPNGNPEVSGLNDPAVAGPDRDMVDTPPRPVVGPKDEIPRQ